MQNNVKYPQVHPPITLCLPAMGQVVPPAAEMTVFTAKTSGQGPGVRRAKCCKEVGKV